MDEYFNLIEFSFKNNYIRTICNMRLELIDKYKDLSVLLNQNIINNITNISTIDSFINLYLNLNISQKFNSKLLELQEIKFCNISKNNNISISLININNINYKIKNKNNNKLDIRIIENGINSNKILEYLYNTDNSYSKNNKRKNNKKKQSLSAWKNININNKSDKYSYTNNNNYILENIIINNTIIHRNIINIIEIKNDQIITSGRTLLPGTILFTFKNKSRISIKKNWIQIIPSKNNTNETYLELKQNILNLLDFIMTILFIENNNINSSFIEDYNNSKNNYYKNIIKNINYNCDFIYKINYNLIIPPLKIINNNLKNLNNCITIKGVNNLNNFFNINNNIKHNIKLYILFTKKIYNCKNLTNILNLSDNEILNIYNNIFDIVNLLN